jgi:hypothetical protein
MTIRQSAGAQRPQERHDTLQLSQSRHAEFSFEYFVGAGE